MSLSSVLVKLENKDYSQDLQKLTLKVGGINRNSGGEIVEEVVRHCHSGNE